MTPEQKCRRLAEMVATSWRSSYHDTARIDIPLGTVATLALLRLSDPRALSVVSSWTSLDDGELLVEMSMVWGLLWAQEPYLVEMAHPLHGWLRDDALDSETIAAVRRVVKVAVRAGLSDLSGHAQADARDDADVLGAILTELRAPGDRKHRGEFHTPAALSDVIAQIMLGELPPPGARILEPAAGSGGMIRAAAQQIRRLGGSPGNYLWSMGDIDRYATACCAVNAVLWGLGRQVYIYCGNTLAHADSGHSLAVQMRRAVTAHRDHTLTAAVDEHEHHGWFLRAARLLDQLAAGPRSPRPPTEGHAA